MSKGLVSKYCSIANYLRHVDPTLYDLLQDLCLVKILAAHKNKGVTFLRPTEEVRDKILKLAKGENPEEAADVLQSMVLRDNIPSLSDFSDKIPTYLNKSLPVDKALDSKVTLKNGAVITQDTKFKRRNAYNISVYLLSEKLVPTDGEDIKLSDYEPIKVTGGADLSVGKSRVFENVVRVFCSGNRDPAMELLVAMHGWACDNTSTQGVSELKAAIESKASFDTLATLAIILRPYGRESPYLSDSVFNSFATTMYGQDATYKTSVDLYSRNPEVTTHYSKLASGDGNAISAQSDSAMLASKMSKLNAVKLLVDYYTGKQGGRSASEAFAEAELRVLSATVLENSNGQYDPNELITLYRNCTLDKPYLCGDAAFIRSTGVGFYYSTVYLIARSDALWYQPNTSGESLNSITNDNAFISLNKVFQDKFEARRNASQRNITVLNGCKY